MTMGAGAFSGKPVRRVEDPALLRGEGTYVDNLKIEGMLTLHFVRSPIAHATIRSIDASAARAMPGVVGVYSATDLAFPPAPALMTLRPGAVRPALAEDRVNFVGDPVVVVVAESRATIRSPGPTSSCADASKTSGWPWSPWRAAPSRSIPPGPTMT